MKKYIVIIVILFFINGLSSIAQTTNSFYKKTLKTNEILFNFNSDSLFYYPSKYKNQSWIVFSDRMINYSYYDPSLTNLKDTIGFMEPFYVVEKSNNSLHIIKDPKFSHTGKFSSYAQDYGWVDIGNLLLSSHCLKSKNTFSNLKALPIAADYEEKIVSYKEPGLISISTEISGLTNIYIYKIIEGNLLIGSTPEILNLDNGLGNIYGWVKIDDLVIWDNNTALIPNKDALEKRQEATICNVFNDASSAIRYKESGVINSENILYSRNYSITDSQPIDIFPIIEEDENVLKVAVKQDVVSQTGSIDNSEYINQINKIIESIDNFNKVNYFFVIDATISMQPYIDLLANEIPNCISQLLDNKSDNYRNPDYRFGIVVYRDEIEKEGATEILPLTYDYQSLGRFLRRIKAYSIVDRDLGESVNLGLITALEGFPNDETNNIILIGDAGNHKRIENEVKKNEVINQIIDKDCNLFAIQIYSGENEVYANFVIDQIEILERKTISDLKKKSRINNSDELTDTTNLVFHESQNKLVVNSPFSMGSIYIPESTNTPISQIELTSEIDSIFNYVDDFMKSKREAINSIIFQDRQIDNWSTNNFIYSLMRTKGLDENFSEILLAGKMQYYRMGYVPINQLQEKAGIYEYALWLSRSGLFNIIHSLKDLLGARNFPISMQRQSLFAALKSMNSEFMEPENLSSSFNLSFDQFMHKITGIPIKTEGKYGNLTLSKLTDPHQVSDREINTLLEDIQASLDKLQDYAYDETNFYPGPDEEFYCWLPIRLLPYFYTSEE